MFDTHKKSFHTIELDSPYLDQLMEFIDRNVAKLEHDYYFVHKSRDEWHKYLADPEYAVFGAYDRTNLVAIAAVHFPRADGPRDAVEFRPAPDEDTAIFQSVLVDCEYRGAGLMRLMQQTRQDEVELRGRKTIICKVSAKNIASWHTALKFGFEIARAGPDQTGHIKMYFVKKL